MSFFSVDQMDWLQKKVKEDAKGGMRFITRLIRKKNFSSGKWNLHLFLFAIMGLVIVRGSVEVGSIKGLSGERMG